MDRNYCVYILASRSRSLYTGVTNNLRSRVQQHRGGTVPGIRVAIPHPSAGPLRGLHRHQSGNPAGKGNQRLEAGQKNSAYREKKPYWGGLGGANFCFAIAGVKAGEAKERSKTRNEAKRTAGPSSARKRPRSG